MKVIISSFLLFLAVSSSGQEWKKFEKPNIAFTASYPSSWELKIKEGNRVFFTSPLSTPLDDFRENVNISVTPRPYSETQLTIGMILPALIKKLIETTTSFSLENQRLFTLNEQEVAEIIYKTANKDVSGQVIRATQWFCLYKDRFYVITYTAKEGYKKEDDFAKDLMSSIQFTD
jgi:hypothetical protein